jgi:hypothetical protein
MTTRTANASANATATSTAKAKSRSFAAFRLTISKVVAGLMSVGLLGLVACAPPRSSHVVVGAKNFTEQVVLGELIFRGVASVDNGLVLAGAVPAALLALCADGLLGLAEKRLAVRR